MNDLKLGRMVSNAIMRVMKTKGCRVCLEMEVEDQGVIQIDVCFRDKELIKDEGDGE